MRDDNRTDKRDAEVRLVVAAPPRSSSIRLADIAPHSLPSVRFQSPGIACIPGNLLDAMRQQAAANLSPCCKVLSTPAERIAVEAAMTS